MKKVLFTAVVVVLVAAFGISAFMVVNYLIEGKQQADRYGELSDIAANAQTETTQTQPAQSTETTGETTAPTEPGMLSGYKDIYEMNNDVVGWIKMEGTKMDYPVMQTPEEEKFLNSKNEILSMITMALGGRAAEEIVFNSVTTGAANDIEKAKVMQDV